MPPQSAEPEGILPIQSLRQAVADETIVSRLLTIPDEAFQAASLDLRLGERAHRLRTSFLPGNSTVEDRLPEFSMEEFSLVEGAILERNRPYLIPLAEELCLPLGLRAKANPKSSTGRLDIFTRVITDFGQHFDEIQPGYRGKLYLEVASRTFTIKVKRGLSLNQLRLIRGRARLSDGELLRAHHELPLLYIGDEPLAGEGLPLSQGLFLSVDLSDETRGVGYRAKKNSQLLDLSRIAFYDETRYWERVAPEPGGKLVLEPEEFYLLISAERVTVPPGLAAEMSAFDPTSGELRTHYAGFFDPGFGYDPDGLMKGTKAVMEVRAHDVPFMIEHQQRISKLEFEHMAAEPDVLYGAGLGSSYQYQELTLSKHFVRRGPGEAPQMPLF